MKFRYKTNIACLVLVTVNKNGSNSDFQSHSFNPFSANEEFQNNELDPDGNYCLDKISSLDAN